MAGFELCARDLSVFYGSVQAVKAVNFTLRNEIVALVGPSGCGKSSLLRAVAGLEPIQGHLLANGQDISTLPVHRRRFALMFQDGQLFAHRNVAGNVAYPLAHRGLGRAQKAARVRELLEQVDLAGFERRAVDTLSGGQAQRVALARALAADPVLLLLDEPLSALDKQLRLRLVNDLRAAMKDSGIGGIYVTHDHEEAFTIADRVGVMMDGELLALDTPAAISASADERIQQFFDV